MNTEKEILHIHGIGNPKMLVAKMVGRGLVRRPAPISAALLESMFQRKRSTYKAARIGDLSAGSLKNKAR